jgi:hypothetical protein
MRHANAQAALEALPHFSETNPLNDALETFTVSQIFGSLGQAENADHWKRLAQSVAAEYGLEQTLRAAEVHGWTQAPINVAM